MKSIAVTIDCPQDFTKEAKYIFDLLSTFLGISFVYNQKAPLKTPLTIYYGEDRQYSQGADLFIPSGNWQDNRLRLKWIEHTPALFCQDKEPSLLYSWTGGDIHIGFDIIRASFYLISLEEEYRNLQRDEWNCFSAYFSKKAELKILDFPVINSYFLLIKRCLGQIAKKRGNELTFADLWPQAKPFAACLTHDVDRTYKRGKLARGILRMVAKDSDPYWNFERWLKLEGEYGVKSCFYFCSVSESHRYDPKYDIAEPQFKAVFESLESSGYEIGLHASYNSLKGNLKISKEKAKLDRFLSRPAVGLRQHYLRFDQIETWRKQSEAGFIYDTTLGYNERIGFRAGIALPFFPFDPQLKSTISVLELPLTISDGALFEFMDYSASEAIEASKAFIDRVAYYGGLVVVLWHQRCIDKGDFLPRLETYKAILEYLKSKGAWIARPIDLVDWWKNRLKAVEEGKVQCVA